jgi:hypothetical protein
MQADGATGSPTVPVDPGPDGPTAAADDQAASAPRPQRLRAVGAMAPQRPASCLLW